LNIGSDGEEEQTGRQGCGNQELVVNTSRMQEEQKWADPDCFAEATHHCAFSSPSLK